MALPSDLSALDALSAPLPAWNPEADDVLVCRQVRRETHDVATFVLSARRPCLFRFKPGQFLTLDLAIDGVSVNRCYTISASAARPYRLAITVKRQPGGLVSNWLHDHLKPGGEIRAIGPLGSFTPEPGPRKWLMLSGGSGITPLMSMTRTACDLAEERDIVFVHAARSPADIIFRHELDAMARHTPSLRLAYVCESTAGESHWPGLTGRLSLPMLRLVAPDLAERDVFCCGPRPFMDGVRAMLGETGFPMARYSQESFVFEDLAPGEQDAAEPAPALAPAGRSFRIEFAKSGRIVECGPDTTILAAAKAAGLRLPSSCTRGLCGTCKSRILSGTLDMKHEGGIRQREIDAGLALLCCSRPTSDMVIDR